MEVVDKNRTALTDEDLINIPDDKSTPPDDTVCVEQSFYNDYIDFKSMIFKEMCKLKELINAKEVNENNLSRTIEKP